MPRVLKWMGILAVLLQVAAAFLPWVYIESKELTLTGIDTTGTNYGKPSYLHILFAAFFLLFTLIPRLWAKRVNLLVVALNLAWALRNFFMVSSCQGGECPVKKAGLFLSLAASILMLLSALFPDMRLPAEKKE
jgi:hypothetical protein